MQNINVAMLSNPQGNFIYQGKYIPSNINKMK
jgi:hypothetical protein